MKKYLLITLLSLLSVSVFSQTVKDFAVPVSATVQYSPAKIILQFPADPNALSYNVFRKDKGAGSWGTKIATLDASATSYEDADVSIGDEYEYLVQKVLSGNNDGYGFIFAGLDAPAIENRGRMIVIVDSTFMNPLAAEVLQLRNDLIGDGWAVSIFYAGRNDKPEEVKADIIETYNKYPNTKAVLLLGHVPVPYSGNFGAFPINVPPDGHAPQHNGAWPADVYYGELTDNWTDIDVDNSTATRAANKNIPGDGKFDITILESTVELAVGRIDMYDMPLFSATEEELLKAYLKKSHEWKHKISTALEKALIDDNFGLLGGEMPGVMSWRTFGAMVGAENVAVKDYFTTLRNENYILAYGSGAGSYVSSSGIGRTDSFAVSTNNAAVFNVLFGSYFGDWDVKNSFLRAPLAANVGLTSVWGGRPQWYLQHMALGETIGYANLLTHNNRSGVYARGAFQAGIHVALMGDPSLRMHRVKPVAGLTATKIDNNSKVKLTWSASQDDNIVGYYVYRAGEYWKDFIRHHDYVIKGTEWIDSLPRNGNSIYHVRALRLQTSASGTYYNLSQGVFVEVTGITGGVSVEKIDFSEMVSIYPNPARDIFNISWEGNYNMLDATITDISGKQVYTDEIANNAAIDVSQLANGIYFVRLTNNNYSAVKKLIVN